MEKSVYIAQKLTRFMRKNCQPLSPQILTVVLAFFTLFLSSQVFGQAANIDQIRNSNTYDNSTDPLWVNGNAGASNSHYMEGQSIAYRVLLTGLQSGKTYSIVLGYDTKHSDRMALDYLTHYQRLEPHGPFGHPAEVINPLRMENGSVEYNMTVGIPATRAFPVPDPLPTGYYNNADNGSHGGVDDGTPVDDQPKNSFNNLNNNPAEPNDNIMTLWNGSFIEMNYTVQENLAGTSASAETQIRIKFMASSDSVLFAWGGHIASRLDWGFLNGTPRSASGISGSPYHMRLKQLFVYNGTPVGTKVCNKDSCEVGLGNQDRSLSAAAVIPPPDCSVSGPSKACPETASLIYTTNVTGVSYLWELLNNDANAIISGSNTGQSITVTPNPASGDFSPGGSFNVKLTTTSNGISTICYLGSSVAPGTDVEISDVNVSATATSNQAIGDPPAVPPPGATAYLDRTIGSTSQLQATASSTGGAISSYAWTEVDDLTTPEVINNTSGSFSNAAIANPVYSVTANGTFYMKVVATDVDGCKDSAYVTIIVSGQAPPCYVEGPASVCPGTTHRYFYNPDGDAEDEAAPIPANFAYTWSITPAGASFVEVSGQGGRAINVTFPTDCDKEFTISLRLYAPAGNPTSPTFDVSCSKVVSSDDNTKPVLSGCPADRTIDCLNDLPTPARVTATDNCPAPGTPLIVSFSEIRSNGQNGCSNVITRTWTATDACGNTESCTQVITIRDITQPSISCPPDITLPCGSSVLPATTGWAFASDDCSIIPVVTDTTIAGVTYSDEAVGTCPTGRVITRTWRARDGSGNIRTCTQIITLQAPAARITQGPDQTERTTVAPVAKKVYTSELQVKAFPNPYNTKVNFQFVSPLSGKGVLELYDLEGRRVGVVYNGFLEAGMQKTIEYRIPGIRQKVMIYKLRVGDHNANGKLLSDK